MDLNIPTPGGKKIWQSTTVESILTNEKYKGDALLQKRFTVDFRTKKQKKNEGELPQYYVTGGHAPIIPPETWDEVQKTSLPEGQRLTRRYTMSGKLITIERHYTLTGSSAFLYFKGSEVQHIGTANTEMHHKSKKTLDLQGLSVNF